MIWIMNDIENRKYLII